ncbi:pyridoxamine 5'-phosphate oxidase family protein [Nocardioides sp. GY 10113]|uniref:pyridoxamine 5'-phosphate oxidase family protein n=1 Tax=Nocardioides sp. GY 10113 TaxID=2569761 RepID=UPI00145825A6|nr:pyridoxamine 5'-phosphate oxidase family protein [Nocardioides sp. GY 10113]
MVDAYELGEAECERLLASGVAGRFAITTPDGPYVFPVNYAVVDKAVVVRTSPYGLLGTHAPGATVAFEIDQFDYDYQRGWSVLARGRAEVVPTGPEEEQVRGALAPRPWASGARPLFLRVRWQELTGRRLGAGWDPLSGAPVRRAR